MNRINEIENVLFDLICRYFKESDNYGGISSYNLNLPYRKDEVVTSVVRLIEKNKISILTSDDDENYHIIRFGFNSKEEQIDFLKKNGLQVDFCLYPSQDYLSQTSLDEDAIVYPFKHLLKIGQPQYKILYFEWGILHKYNSDPRYNFEFSDYYGKIFSTENIKEENSIKLNRFGVAKDKNGNYVVAAFIRDLATQPSATQIEWKLRLVDEQEKCNVTSCYIKNLFECCWDFPNTVYRSVIQEITNINLLSIKICGELFFNLEFDKEKLNDFDMIYIPTYKAYMDYILKFETIVINNINVKFFDHFGIDRRDENGDIRGSIALLKIFLEKIKPEIKEQIIQPLKKLRKLRQTPAHKVENNKYDIEYFNKQHSLTVEVFESLCLLRKLIHSHPNAKLCEIKYKQTENYIVL